MYNQKKRDLVVRFYVLRQGGMCAGGRNLAWLTAEKKTTFFSNSNHSALSGWWMG